MRELKRKDFKGKTPLGSGSSRMVFELDSDTVVKFSRGRTPEARAKGRDQNELEFDLFHHVKFPILCPIHFISEDGSYLVMSRAIPIHTRNGNVIPEEYKEKVAEFQALMSRMYKLFKLLSHDTVLSKFKTLKKARPYLDLFDHVLFHYLYSLVFDYDMIRGDLFRKTSWGIYKDGFVLIDYGLSRDVYNKYYAKKKQKYGYMEGPV